MITTETFFQSKYNSVFYTIKHEGTVSQLIDRLLAYKSYKITNSDCPLKLTALL